jgi:hypothetical protein
MGGHDNESSINFGRDRFSHSNSFIKHRRKLWHEWKQHGLDRKMTFLEYCKQKKKKG